MTVDGKAKKACMLELIPEEGETVKLVYALFAETHSLTATETELLRRGVTTKTEKHSHAFPSRGFCKIPSIWLQIRQPTGILYNGRQMCFK